MTGAMYAAIAGLKAHMSKMNVIGNNIANVNTNGYKTQRTVFKDAMYTMYSKGSDGSAEHGGKNPSQVGYGSQISSIDLDMHTGTYTLGRGTDCMIYGDGFFMVGSKDLTDGFSGTNPDTLKSVQLTRVGDFEFKSDGYLCDGNGNPVYGFLTTGVDATGKVTLSDQLVPIRLPRTEKNAEGKMEVKYPVQEGNERLHDYEPDKDLPTVKLDSISINPDTGAITGTDKNTDQMITIGYLAIANVTNPNGVTHTNGFYYKAGDGAGDLDVSMLGGQAEQFENFEYVNGSLADGEKPDKMKIGSAGGTNLMTGGLEGSNVDLASEISEMITTQRGYQANTRIITVTDSMLEELVNIKR